MRDGQVLRRGASGARAEDQTFEQRVRRQAVRAVDARAGDLARGVESGQAGAPFEVCADAAHDVMRRRADGDGVAREVEAEAKARRVDFGEAASQVSGVEGRHVEEDGARGRALHFGDD